MFARFLLLLSAYFLAPDMASARQEDPLQGILQDLESGDPRKVAWALHRCILGKHQVAAPAIKWCLVETPGATKEERHMVLSKLWEALIQLQIKVPAVALEPHRIRYRTETTILMIRNLEASHEALLEVVKEDRRDMRWQAAANALAQDPRQDLVPLLWSQLHLTLRVEVLPGTRISEPRSTGGFGGAFGFRPLSGFPRVMFYYLDDQDKLGHTELASGPGPIYFHRQARSKPVNPGFDQRGQDEYRLRLLAQLGGVERDRVKLAPLREESHDWTSDAAYVQQVTGWHSSIHAAKDVLLALHRQRDLVRDMEEVELNVSVKVCDFNKGRRGTPLPELPFPVILPVHD